MGDEVLDSVVRQYCESQRSPELTLAWHGGEPTLMGLEFFRRAVELEKRHAGGRRVLNSLQTNATLITDEWAAFLAENAFRVQVSIDGPVEHHDAFRKDRGSPPLF